MSNSPPTSSRRSGSLLGRARARIVHEIGRLCGPEGHLRILSPVLTAYLPGRETTRWDRDWVRETQRPASELSTIVPVELIRLVEEEWFPPGARVLDIGSGRGQISAWLAQQGFRVLGVDLSPEAIRLTRAHFQDFGDRLEFRTIDICGDTPEEARFDALVDRCCFHVVPPLLRPRYIANVAAWAKDGARFLLLCRESQAPPVPRLFEPYFELVRAQPMAGTLRRSAGPIPRWEEPGIEFRMIRRASSRI
jgi:SAM-dependent methyltransferase